MMEIIQKQIDNVTTLGLSQAPIARTWVEISRAAFEHNLMLYKNLVTPALFAPVIKSNAYGHGIEAMAALCDASAAVDRICVVSLSEAMKLRTLSIKKPILVLSFIDAALEAIAEQEIIVTIYNLEMAIALNQVGQLQNKKITVHIKIDTGLSRLGVAAAHAFHFIQQVAALPFIFVEGIFTHFANSESDDQSFMYHQLEQFNAVNAALEKAGIVIPLRHTSCSAAITAHQSTHYTMSRAGIGIYGLWSSPENKEMTHKNNPLFNLMPVLTWKTTVIHMKEVPIGSFVGYDLTHQTNRTTRIATLPVGYWDGYDRKLSNNSMVMIHNQQAPVIGRIAMNLMMIDVTDVAENVAVGDEVILLGNYAGVTADDMAARCETINYEVVTHINPLLPRVVV